jgi:hypothetical protein
MTRGVITSEAPQIHWEHINVKGGRVLDLGCGFWTEGERQEGNGTAKYFLLQKPEFYMGIDTNQGDIESLAKQYPEGKFLCQRIESSEQIQGLIKENLITHIKCDIEGEESRMLQIADVGTLKEIAIELHYSDLWLKEFMAWFQSIGFECYRHDSVSFCPEISVIYGRLKC